MVVDLVCSCGAGMVVEVDDEDNMTGAWMLVHRFGNAHVKCGYMTRLDAQDPVPKNIER